MKMLILLGWTIEDWDKADKCRADAEMWWRMVKRRHPQGKSEELHFYMTEIRSELDELTRLLKAEKPSAPGGNTSEDEDQEEDDEEYWSEHHAGKNEELEAVRAVPDISATAQVDHLDTTEVFDKAEKVSCPCMPFRCTISHFVAVQRAPPSHQYRPRKTFRCIGTASPTII
jgi:dsDNA-binding SOS-regulon protein